MLNELKALLKSCSFDDQAEEYGGVNEYYRADKRQHDKAKRKACDILMRYTPTDNELLEASKTAFSGRLEWLGNRWKYCAGQYYPLELPQAICAVLDYARIKKGVLYKALINKKCKYCNEPLYTTIQAHHHTENGIDVTN